MAVGAPLPPASHIVPAVGSTSGLSGSGYHEAGIGGGGQQAGERGGHGLVVIRALGSTGPLRLPPVDSIGQAAISSRSPMRSAAFRFIHGNGDSGRLSLVELPKGTESVEVRAWGAGGGAGCGTVGAGGGAAFA